MMLLDLLRVILDNSPIEQEQKERIRKEIELQCKCEEYNLSHRIPHTSIDKALYNAWQKNKRS